MSRIYKRNGKYGIDFVDSIGVRIRKLVATDKKVAKEILNSYLGKVARQEHLGLRENSAIGFAAFADLWLERITPTLAPRSLLRWSVSLRLHLKPHFAESSLRSITPARIEDFIATRRGAGAAPATINCDLTALGHLLLRAHKWGYLSSNPAAEVRKLRQPEPPTRVISPEELDRLIKAADLPFMRELIILLANSGLRRNEALNLVRSNIDWSNRTAMITETKNHHNRLCFLNDAALQALHDLPVRLDGRLFPLHPSTASGGFTRIATRAGVTGVSLHTLRHSFATTLAISGLPQQALMQLLGHRDGRMTLRYQHVATIYLRSAIDALQPSATPTAPPLSTAIKAQ